MIAGRCVANFTNDRGELCEVYRSGNRYAIYVGKDTPTISRITADEMIRVVASWADHHDAEARRQAA